MGNSWEPLGGVTVSAFPPQELCRELHARIGRVDEERYDMGTRVSKNLAEVGHRPPPPPPQPHTTSPLPPNIPHCCPRWRSCGVALPGAALFALRCAACGCRPTP